MAEDLPLQSIIVLSEDDRKFKMVMRGSLDKLSVEKIKRYLTRSTNVEPGRQLLRYKGRLLSDDMLGEDFGLQPDDVLHLAYLRDDETTHGAAAQGQYRESDLHQNVAFGGAPLHSTHQQQSQPSSQAAQRYPPTSGEQSTSASQQQQQGLLRDEVGRRRQAEELAHKSPVTSSRGQVSGPQGGNGPSPTVSRRLMDPQGSFGPGTDTSRSGHHTGGSFSAAQPAYPQHQLPYATGMSPGPSTTGGGRGSARDQYSGYPPPPSHAPPPAPSAIIDPEHPLMTKIASLEDDNRALRHQIEKMKKEESQRTFLQPAPALTVIANARANLQELSKDLGVHLTFDDNLSCVIGVDDANTIILTVDPPTERLYMYSTLATTLPSDAVLKLRLFESLLEWGLLGRDMAGGGVGIDSRAGLVMMSTSIDLKHANHLALKDTAPVFIESLARWRAAVAAVEPPTGTYR